MDLQAQQWVNMNEGWKFHLGHGADPAKDFNYGIANIFSKSGNGAHTPIDPLFNDSGWTTLSLPHDWAVALPFVKSDNPDIISHGFKPIGAAYPGNSIGWYRKKFSLSLADSNNQVFLRFDGIYRNASIWVNGFYVAQNSSGYIGDSYDITNFVQVKKENLIVVRVDATQFEGWYYEGAGIYRNVWLKSSHKFHIAPDGIYASSILNGKDARLTIKTTLQNASNRTVRGYIISYLQSRDGKTLTRTKKTEILLVANSSKTIQQLLQVHHSRNWSIHDPYLYRLRTVLLSANTELDAQVERIGIRSVHFDPAKGFFLNGKHLKIKGTNNHQDHAGLGTALPDGMNYYRIGLLKNMGANAYRSSHNPPSPALLDACDSMGMLVLDENRLLNSSGEYLHQFERMIRRDRNHASVFLWSIGNEEGFIQTTENGKKIAASLMALQQQLDPSRTCTYAADLANVFTGVNEVIPIRGFNYREDAVAAYHKDHPRQPVLGTEMGSTVCTRGVYENDSLRGYLPDHDSIAPWWASTAEKWWKLAALNPYWQGGFIWTGFDYRGEPFPNTWPNIQSHFGVMDICGFPKNNYYYYQSWWTNKNVLNISPHWNWQGKEGKPVDVWVNSNAESVELKLNGKSLGKKTMEKNGHLQWKIPYEPGKLEAIAYKAGSRFSKAIETTGATKGILLTPNKTSILADGKEIAVLNISLVDQQGREVPTANNLIHFTISGPGKIIGVGNGDPSNHEPDKWLDGAWQRSAFNGKCQVILQSEKAPGTITFQAAAEGLWSSGTEIIAIDPVAVHQIDFEKKYKVAASKKLKPLTQKILGADISYLPELEAAGIQFSDNGKQEDLLQILKKHGFNYIRLRIFNNPGGDSGYSPAMGFCDLAHTKAMAKRIKDAGLKFLLDFHYSDTWADPGKQKKPAAWQHLGLSLLKDSLYKFTEAVMQELSNQGTLPDMVQVGNEINHGILWPEGGISHVDALAQLLTTGIAAVKSVHPAARIMLHVALGGQNEESVFFLDQMLLRKVPFDIIGESYYPQWHGTLADLENNLNDLANRYQKQVVVVEYSERKKEVNNIVFNLKGGYGLGSFIWEPLNTWEAFFDKDGKSNHLLNTYDELNKQFIER